MKEIACNLGAFNPAQRKSYNDVVGKLRLLIIESRELSDGWAFRIPADSAALILAAEFVTLERLRCPFLNFELQVLNSGSQWLRVRGEGEAKELLRRELVKGLTHAPDVARLR
jgi:hypothetical protein